MGFRNTATLAIGRKAPMNKEKCGMGGEGRKLSEASTLHMFNTKSAI